MSNKDGYVKRTYGDNNAPGGGRIDMSKVPKSRYDDHSHVHRERRQREEEEKNKKKNPSTGASTSQSR